MSTKLSSTTNGGRNAWSSRREVEAQKRFGEGRGLFFAVAYSDSQTSGEDSARNRIPVSFTGENEQQRATRAAGREVGERDRRKHPWPAPAHQRLWLRGETHWRPGTMPSAFRSRGRESRPRTGAPRDRRFLLFSSPLPPLRYPLSTRGPTRFQPATSLMNSGLMFFVRVLSPRVEFIGETRNSF